MIRYAAALSILLSILSPRMTDGSFAEQRRAMIATIERQARDLGIRIGRGVLKVMASTPRHLFVPAASSHEAYHDWPVGIGAGQTISQPFMVAYMTDLAEPDPDDVVLEVGTGSGYQAAVLSPLVARVYSIEIVPELAQSAARRLAEMGYRNVTVRQGDGYAGWAEHAPFDAIVVTAGAPHIPPALVEQLKPGGRLVIPVGSTIAATQDLMLVTKDRSGRVVTRNMLPVRFVPLVRDKHERP
jgi:protein-L-isoaspartate(D-aspartate) O-methyltransferase